MEPGKEGKRRKKTYQKKRTVLKNLDDGIFLHIKDNSDITLIHEHNFCTPFQWSKRDISHKLTEKQIYAEVATCLLLLIFK